MTDNGSSYGQILRSTTIFGGVSVIKILIGLVKVKILAVLLGPSGIGLIGLYQGVINVTSLFSGLGLSSSGVRQIAASSNDNKNLEVVRYALWYGNLILGVIGMILLWVFREPAANLIFDDISYSVSIGWLSIGVLLTLIAGSQTALLQGLRKIEDLARVSIYSALASLLVGTVAAWSLGHDGILWIILAWPATSMVVAFFYVAKLPRISFNWINFTDLSDKWRAMIVLGVTFMVTQLMTQMTMLGVRSYVVAELSFEAGGYFQASWAISVTYLGFILAAMSADYYPRLTSAIDNKERANKLASEQTEVALLLSAPAILAVYTLSHWLIPLLYSIEFSPAIEVLRWQIMGDIFKIMTWPIGFILVARGNWFYFLLVQLLWSVIYIFTIWFGLKTIGITITGIAFFVACIFIVIGCSIMVRQINGYKWKNKNIIMGLGILLLCTVVRVIFIWSTSIGVVFGMISVVVIGLLSIQRLSSMVGDENRLGIYIRRVKSKLESFLH